jgi:hypothetical protein
MRKRTDVTRAVECALAVALDDVANELDALAAHIEAENEKA